LSVFIAFFVRRFCPSAPVLGATAADEKTTCGSISQQHISPHWRHVETNPCHHDDACHIVRSTLVPVRPLNHKNTISMTASLWPEAEVGASMLLCAVMHGDTDNRLSGAARTGSHAYMQRVLTPTISAAALQQTIGH
jgi:hypothetical protein